MFEQMQKLFMHTLIHEDLILTDAIVVNFVVI